MRYNEKVTGKWLSNKKTIGNSKVIEEFNRLMQNMELVYGGYVEVVKEAYCGDVKIDYAFYSFDERSCHNCVCPIQLRKLNRYDDINKENTIYFVTVADEVNFISNSEQDAVNHFNTQKNKRYTSKFYTLKEVEDYINDKLREGHVQIEINKESWSRDTCKCIENYYINLYKNNIPLATRISLGNFDKKGFIDKKIEYLQELLDENDVKESLLSILEITEECVQIKGDSSRENIIIDDGNEEILIEINQRLKMDLPIIEEGYLFILKNKEYLNARYLQKGELKIIDYKINKICDRKELITLFQFIISVSLLFIIAFMDLNLSFIVLLLIVNLIISKVYDLIFEVPFEKAVAEKERIEMRIKNVERRKYDYYY